MILLRSVGLIELDYVINLLAAVHTGVSSVCDWSAGGGNVGSLALALFCESYPKILGEVSYSGCTLSLITLSVFLK